MQDEIPGSRLLELDYADADVVSLWTERQGPALVVRRCRVVRELDELDRLVEVARVHATRPDSSIHGVDHWERVGRNGEQLAAETAGADIEVVRVFAAFHDSQRLNDGRDPEHGARAAEKVRQLELGLSRAQLDTLCAALADHDRGNVSDDPTVGSCWDADRLDLVRLGIRPRPALMSTAAGKELAETG